MNNLGKDYCTEISKQIIIKAQFFLYLVCTFFTASDFMYKNKVLISIYVAFNQSLNIQICGYHRILEMLAFYL